MGHVAGTDERGALNRVSSISHSKLTDTTRRWQFFWQFPGAKEGQRGPEKGTEMTLIVKTEVVACKQLRTKVSRESNGCISFESALRNQRNAKGRMNIPWMVKQQGWPAQAKNLGILALQ